MSLPEFDDRPGAGEPLFDDSKGSGWDNIKFPVLVVVLPVLAIVLFGSGIISFVESVIAAFR